MVKFNTSGPNIFDARVNKRRNVSHAYIGASLTIIALSSAAAWVALAWLAYNAINH